LDDKKKKPYLSWMLTIFGAIALSIIFFFIIFKFEEFGGVISKLVSIVRPIIYGACITYLFRPICNFYERFLIKHTKIKKRKTINLLAVALSMISAIVIVYLILMIIIPQVFSSIMTLINIVPSKLDDASTWLDNVVEHESIYGKYINDIYEQAKVFFTDWITNVLQPNLQSVIEGVGTGILNSLMFVKDSFIGIVVAVYLLTARRNFKKHFRLILASIFKPKWYDMINEELIFADSVFVGFLNGKILDSAIIGVICYICCQLFDFPNAMLISVIIGVTNIIPFFGPFIGAIPSALLILIESPIQTVWFVIFIIVLQQIDGNIIGPKILGNKTGLSSFWVLFSILLFGGMWGFIGMVIGVPLFAVIYDVIGKLVYFGLKRNGREDMIEEGEKKVFN